MNEHDSTSIAARIVGDARRRVGACHADLRNLLGEARKKYEGTIADLDALESSGSGRRGGSLASRMEAVRQSQLLHQAGGEFDNCIARISDALTQLAGAADSLEGKVGRLGPAQRPVEASLEAVAIQAQEEERYRLAREIHDGPAQILANVALQLEYISKLATRDPARARDEMANIQKDLRLAVGEVRRFMYDLRPPALAQQGVGPAVDSHCQRLTERFGAEFAVHWESSSTLPPSHDTAVFRIVQEALQNVVKHAQATKVEVRAVDEDGLLVVSVADNGKGFDAGRVRDLDPKHFGLAGMRARAHQIGATIDVLSTPEQGTSIFLRVPLAL